MCVCVRGLHEYGIRTVDEQIQLHNKTNKLILKMNDLFVDFPACLYHLIAKVRIRVASHRMSQPSVWTVQQTGAWKG